METDCTIYYVVDCVTHERIMHAIRIGLEMAKESYPYLEAEFQDAIKRAMENTETFRGVQNKPHTRKAYNLKKYSK